MLEPIPRDSIGAADEHSTFVVVIASAGAQPVMHRLPGNGRVLIGSAGHCDIRLMDPSVAPIHAAISTDGDLIIQNLAADAATSVVDRQLMRGEESKFTVGDVLKFGGVAATVQRRRPSLPFRRIWSHSQFEVRLEEECLRAARSSSPFTILRVRGSRDAKSEQIEQALAGCIRSSDVIASYGPSDYEVLLTGAGPDAANSIADRLRQRLAADSVRADVAIACAPRDARNPDELIAILSTTLAGGERASIPSIVSGPPSRLDEILARIAESEISVLIMGETGVGKGYLAERIHALSPRSKGPFLRLSCASIPESLLESELFGHERGAFTGAVQAKRGLLETAEGGTVFLDEVGEISPPIQVKLLRVCEDRSVLRVGGIETHPINVRLISATNRDLEAEMERRTFRQDLFFRLNGISLLVPPLRERPAEIEILANGFIRELAARNDRNPPRLSQEALERLKRYSWPGNVRELRNLLERAMVLCSGDTITPDHISADKMNTRFVATPSRSRPSLPPHQAMVSLVPEVRVAQPPVQLPKPNEVASIERVSWADEVREQVSSLERERILQALVTCGGNQTAAAKLMGMSRRTLVNRLEAYGIPRPRKTRGRS